MFGGICVDLVWMVGGVGVWFSMCLFSLGMGDCYFVVFCKYVLCLLFEYIWIIIWNWKEGIKELFFFFYGML